MSDSETPVPPDPGVTPPSPPDPPTSPPTEPVPEPIFIAEQTPIPPSPDPIIPPPPDPIIPPNVPEPTTQLPITPAAGIPTYGEPTSAMPPVAVINPGGPAGPGGPGGPMGPDQGEPEEPWYRKPGPIAIVVLIALLLLGLLAWLLNGGDGNDDDVVVDTTISDTSTSLLPETTLLPATTLLPETTVLPATTAAPQTTAAPATTEAPETTATPTTTAAPTTTLPSTTTTTIPDIIPEPGETLWDVIARDSDLSELKGLIEIAGLEEALNDPDATFTLFAPTNEALQEAFGDNPEDMDEELLQNLLLAHVHDGEAFPEAALLALSEVSVMFGGPQQIDSDASPPTVGGAPIVLEAPPTENGILYVISKVIQPVAD